MSAGSESPWYADGLRFSCTRCGNCCGGESGTVLVSAEEIAALAARLELSQREFRAMYTESLPSAEQVTLRERPNKDCIFYAPDRGCTVYEDRPRQCRSWPFWHSVVMTAGRWDEESGHCPGMNRGTLIPAESILSTSRDDGTSGKLPQGKSAR